MNEYSLKVVNASATALCENAMFIEEMLHKKEFIERIGDLDFNFLADLNNILGYVYFLLESIAENENAVFEYHEALERLSMLGNHIHIMDQNRFNGN